MPGRYINQYEENEFASYEFTGDKGSVVVVEGHKIRMGYTWAGDKKKPAFCPGDPQIRKRPAVE